MKTAANNERDLKQIIIWGSAFPTGVMLAALEALQPNFSFRLSALSVVAFVFGMALVLGFWKVVFNTDRPLYRAAVSAVMIFVGLAAFLYPLRFVSVSRFSELFTGLASATFALSIVAIFMLKLRDFFNEDEPVAAAVRANCP